MSAAAMAAVTQQAEAEARALAMSEEAARDHAALAAAEAESRVALAQRQSMAAELAAAAGWRLTQRWHDIDDSLSLLLLKPAD